MPKSETAATTHLTASRLSPKAKAIAPQGGQHRRKRGRPRLDQVEQRDRELLEHALEQFLEKGYEGTTVEAITSPLGMAKRTVYSRYGDKLALFRAALEHAIDDWLKPFKALPELECNDIEETMYRIAQVIVDTLMCPTGQRLIRITNTESYRMPEIGTYTYQRGSQELVEFLMDLFQRRILSGGNSNRYDPEELAVTFLNILSGPARLSALGLSPGTKSTAAITRQRVRIFLQGVLPR